MKSISTIPLILALLILMKPTHINTQDPVLSLNTIQQQSGDGNGHKPIIYHQIFNYSDYTQRFMQIAGKENTYQVTHLGTGTQICDNNMPCRFYIYFYQPPTPSDTIQPRKPEQSMKQYEKRKEGVKNTVLITGGLHGNQRIGPTSLLYAYQLLKPENTRIIYFPIGNPSGYNKQMRETYPQKIDPNRDYPIDNNTLCYETSATRIIDSIFRNYSIDLTLNLHNGGDQIGWNWGTVTYKKISHTVQYDIQLSIGQMLKFYGGYNNRLGMKNLKIGTMTQSIYPAVGTLDDWAYAASWDNTVPKKCAKYSYKQYPKDMHKGLVFLFQLGMHNAPESKLGTSQGLDENPSSSKDENGFVTRTLRMLVSIIKVMEPKVTTILNQSRILIKVEGCGQVSQASMIIKSKMKSTGKSQQIEFIRLGDSQYSFVNIAQVNIPDQYLKYLDADMSLEIDYSIKCDKNWKGMGNTIFSKDRDYYHSVTIEKKDNITDETQIQNFYRVAGKQGDNLWGIIIFSLLICVLLLITARYYGCKNKLGKWIKESKQRQDKGRLKVLAAKDHELFEQQPANAIDQGPQKMEEIKTDDKLEKLDY